MHGWHSTKLTNYSRWRQNGLCDGWRRRPPMTVVGPETWVVFMYNAILTPPRHQKNINESVENVNDGDRQIMPAVVGIHTAMGTDTRRWPTTSTHSVYAIRAVQRVKEHNAFTSTSTSTTPSAPPYYRYRSYRTRTRVSAMNGWIDYK